MNQSDVDDLSESIVSPDARSGSVCDGRRLERACVRLQLNSNSHVAVVTTDAHLKWQIGLNLANGVEYRAFVLATNPIFGRVGELVERNLGWGVRVDFDDADSMAGSADRTHLVDAPVLLW